jgi:hypothetical protein
MLCPANILGYMCLVSLASTGTPLPFSGNAHLRIGSFPPRRLLSALTKEGSKCREPLFLRETPPNAVEGSLFDGSPAILEAAPLVRLELAENHHPAREPPNPAFRPDLDESDNAVTY